MDETIELIKTYDSQVQKTDFLEVLISMRRHHGHIIRVKYAEAFVTEMPILITPENLTGLL